MPHQVRGWAALQAGGPLVPFTFERRDMRPDDVAIDILYCGVCHSDIHHVMNDWGTTTYPVVPGHEIVGRVRAVGSAVTKFKPGDLAGVGCLVDSCRCCRPCRLNFEQYCEKKPTLTYDDRDRRDGTLNFGGYAESILASERFVLRIPQTLDPAGAAPLLCAGITTYSPLRHWGAGPGKKVAVVGLGGLGHMALKLARAMGAEVTLLSRSPRKIPEALRLGAHDVVISTNPEEMAAAAGRFDLIIDTVPYVHDLNPYTPLLALDGTLVLVGYLGPLADFNTAQLFRPRRTIAGSLIGGLAETQEMLDFCGEHGIAAEVELIAMEDINEAYARLLKSDVKYRFVIDMQRFAQERAG